MEWTVVGVIVTIAGLLATVTAPLIKNTKAMTKLSSSIEHLNYRMKKEEEDLASFKEKSAKNHQKIYDKLDNHEERIDDLEYKTKHLN